MTKKVLSLLITLAISIVLLTVTALADDYAPETLYVGGTEITDGGCWTTDTDGKLTKCTETGDNWNVKYEKSSGTLTLHNATIKGNDSNTNPAYGSGIYAVSSNDSKLTLNILLEGDNTVTGKSGIYVEANKDTALKITGSGSLTATGT